MPHNKASHGNRLWKLWIVVQIGRLAKFLFSFRCCSPLAQCMAEENQ